MGCSIDPADFVHDWISTELRETLGREPTPEEVQMVVDELPGRVSKNDVKRIVSRLFFGGGLDGEKDD